MDSLAHLFVYVTQVFIIIFLVYSPLCYRRKGQKVKK